MPLSNQKQVVELGGYRPCSSYHKTTALLTLIEVVDSFWGLGQKCFITLDWNQSSRNIIMLKSGNNFVVMDGGQASDYFLKILLHTKEEKAGKSFLFLLLLYGWLRVLQQLFYHSALYQYVQYLQYVYDFVHILQLLDTLKVIQMKDDD